MNDFYLGQYVNYDGHPGYVNFIDEKYITVCIREINQHNDSPPVDKRNVRQVCLLVFPNEWHKVIPTPQKVINRISTENAEIVENIK